jgi:hypothetical protein
MIVSMYTYLSHLFLYNDICYPMYVINIMVVMMMMFVGLRPRMIGSCKSRDNQGWIKLKKIN